MVKWSSHTPKPPKESNRPAIVDARTEMGQWEADTVVGRRNGKETVVFTLVSRMTSYYIAMRIPAKTSGAIHEAMQILHAEFGERFVDVFKTIITDNGSEFEDFAQTE